MNTLDTFKAVLLQISQELKDDNLKNLKFLCSDCIGKKHLEKVNMGTELFQLLQEANKIAPGDTDFLCELLDTINRRDLGDKLRLMQNNTSEQPDAEEQEKVKIAADVIVKHLGKDWRKYGRSLGLHEAKLDQIREKHPFNLEEQVMEVISEWKRVHKGDVKAEELVKALRSCRLNYTADLVQSSIVSSKT